METIPFWKRKPDPAASMLAERFDLIIRALVILTGGKEGPAEPTVIESLREEAGRLGRQVIGTEGASVLVQRDKSHSAALALQCIAQHPSQSSLQIGTETFPSWGELRRSSELPAWQISPA